MQTDTAENISAQSIALFAMTLLGIGIGFATSIAAARFLGMSAFDDFAVACAMLGLLSTIAEAGVGKYAFKVIPRYIAKQLRDVCSGYLRFAAMITFAASAVLMFAGLAIYWTPGSESSIDTKQLTVLFLPAAVVVGVGTDTLMAFGRMLSASSIVRIVIPMTTLVLLVVASCVMSELPSKITPESNTERESVDETGIISVRVAIACYGVSTVVGAALILIVLSRSMDARIWSAQQKYNVANWMRECLSFAVSTFLAASAIRLILVTIGQLDIDDHEVSHFAAAADAGCLVVLIAKSTDKLFQPAMSLMMDEHDFVAGNKLRWIRYRFVGTGCAVFLLTMVLFGRSVLSIYCEDFVDAYAPLLIISFGSCLMTLFSLAPTYLRVEGRSRFVLIVITINVVASLALAVWLTPVYGAVGAALAYAVPGSTLAMTFFFAALSSFRSLQSH